MSFRQTQQIVGILMAIVSAGFVAWSWYSVFYGGYFYVKAGFIFPAFFVIGLGLALFPGYREERTARGEDISQLQGLQLLTSRWWAVLVIALIAGLINYVLLSL
jgi:hypothetical protein